MASALSSQLARHAVCTGFALQTVLLQDQRRDLTKNRCRCESKVHQKKLASSGSGTNDAVLKRRMTSIGQFSLESETPTNPSVMAFYVALGGPQKLERADFLRIWEQRGMSIRHPRFLCRLSNTNKNTSPSTPDNDEGSNGFFVQDVNVADRVTESRMGVACPVPREDLKYRIGRWMMGPSPKLSPHPQPSLQRGLDLTKGLWEAELLSGPLGSSGAIPMVSSQDKNSNENDKKEETVVLFRAHHCLGDGVSLTAAMVDLADEAEELHHEIQTEIEKRRTMRKKKKKRFLHKLRRFLEFWMGVVRALLYQLYLWAVTPSVPIFIFDEKSNNGVPVPRHRAVSFCDVGSLEEANVTARRLSEACGRKVTINDMFATCLAAAVRRQCGTVTGGNNESTPPPAYVNIVMPVHLSGGVLLPEQGHGMGNYIGAMVARLPTDGYGAVDRVSSSLGYLKDRTKMAVLSYALARLGSQNLSPSWQSWFFEGAHCNAAAVLTNVRGPTKCLHLDGRPMLRTAGFVPLPPGVPIGVSLQSYAGALSLTVTADPRAVPDPDAFLRRLLEEYRLLAASAQSRTTELKKIKDVTIR